MNETKTRRQTPRLYTINGGGHIVAAYSKKHARHIIRDDLGYPFCWCRSVVELRPPRKLRMVDAGGDLVQFLGVREVARIFIGRIVPDGG